MLSAVISGCGYSVDHALDYHEKQEVTEAKSNVITGSVYTTTGKAVSLKYHGQNLRTLTPEQRASFNVSSDHPIALDQDGFLDDNNNFYFQKANTNEVVSAAFDTYTLYSFYQGTPIPVTDVTISQERDWHGSSKLTIRVGSGWPLSTVSINPFSNLSYWLGGGSHGSYATYSKARNKIDTELGLGPVLPTCWSEVSLCNSKHLEFLQQGNTIAVAGDQFTITRNGTPCTGNFSNYTGTGLDTKPLCP